MQGCDWWTEAPHHTQSNNFYLLSHVSNSNHLPPQKAVTLYKIFLQILLNPKEAIYFFVLLLSRSLPTCLTSPPLFTSMFNVFLIPLALLCSPLRLAVDWRRADRANQSFTAFFLLAHLPPSPFVPPKSSRENRTWWSLRPDYCLDTLLATPPQRHKHTHTHTVSQQWALVWGRDSRVYLSSHISNTLNNGSHYGEKLTIPAPNSSKAICGWEVRLW